MKTIGKTDARWSLQQAIQQQIEKESWLEWSKKSVTTVTYDYRPTSLKLSETAKYVFGSTIHFVKSLPKL